MNKLISIMAVAILSIGASANPLLKEYKTPHHTPPFDKIKVTDFEPAFREAIKMNQKEIDAIINNRSIATFENTVKALEVCGRKLSSITAIFYNLLSTESSEQMRDISQKIQPMLTEHGNNISLNQKLFERIQHVYNNREKLNLTAEQNRLLEESYKSFEKSGATLSGEKKDIYRKLSAELSQLTLTFGQNSLKATNAYSMHLTKKEQIDGLPETALNAAAMRAKSQGKEGWIIDLSAPSYMAFMKYASNRALRQELYMAYNTRCMAGSEFDNSDNVKRIAALRMEIAQLMGYKTFADYQLQNRMAQKPENVYNLLEQLLEAYHPKALLEIKEIEGFAIAKQGTSLTLMPWDYSYYSNQLKSIKYNFDEEALRPYFELERVKKGVFSLATQLYGLTFVKNSKIPVYNKEVDAYEVFDKSGKFLSVLFTDFHPRQSKRQGAWMTEFKGQYRENGVDSRPHVSIVMNFTRPTETEPALLSFYEFTTFLHEFGHALHGMLANSTYESLSGTNVARDFVELPSQVLENWGTEKEYLDQFAMHYKTQEKIPAAYIEALLAADKADVGYSCIRQLTFGLMDMAWYTQQTATSEDVVTFERQATAKTALLPPIDGTCMSVTFNHIFSGGYAAGYYGYKWAEVLDADAFALFKQNGIFDPKTASLFRDEVLSKGKSDLPMVLYKKFRGSEPTIDALLKRDLIKQ